MKNFKTVLILLSLAVGLRAQSPNYPYTTLIVPFVDLPGAPSGSYVKADGTGYGTPGGGGSGTVGSGTAGQIAKYYANGTSVAGSTSHSVTITDAPFNAVCDGATDDSVAIQAALNSGADWVNLPSSVSIFQVCNFGTPLTIPAFVNVNFNGGALQYTATSGTAITDHQAYNTFYDGALWLTAQTGTVTGLEIDNGYAFLNFFSVILINGAPAPTTYINTSIVNASVVWNYGAPDGEIDISTTSPETIAMSFNNMYIGHTAETYRIPKLINVLHGFIGTISFNAVRFEQSGAGNNPSDCVICVEYSANGASNALQDQFTFNNVQVDTIGTYTGSILSNTTSGGGTPPTYFGSINTALFTAGSLFTGPWTGRVDFGGTTYRGSAALLTYRCNGGTQAGLIYTNNSSCTGGTAVATGDSVQ